MLLFHQYFSFGSSKHPKCSICYNVCQQILIVFLTLLSQYPKIVHCLYLQQASNMDHSDSSSSTTSNENIEQCYYHYNGGNQNTVKTVFYGQCMSMNGPNGCCLDGHYKPGICSNLGHICCTKPDPECNAMRFNKGITKSITKQYKRLFMDNNNIGQNRAIRSNSPTRFKQYRTNFEIIEMPAHMQLDAVAFAISGIDRFNGDFSGAADYLCQMLDQKYEETGPWACTIGKDFGFAVDPIPGKYLFFYLGTDVSVMAFVSKSY